MVFGNMPQEDVFSNVHHIIGSIIGECGRLSSGNLPAGAYFIFLGDLCVSAKQEAEGKVPAAGSGICGCCMDDFSGIFSVYVDKYNNYSSFYGTMTTIALIMGMVIWLHVCAFHRRYNKPHMGGAYGGKKNIINK